MLPNGWKLGDFGSIGKWTGGGTPSKANDSFWMGGTIPWVSPKDMTSGKICDTEDHITPEAIKNSATRLYPSGSVMIVTRSGILRKKLPVAIAESPVTVNQDLKVLPYDKQFSPEYVYNYILCFNSEILNVCAKDGTTVESIDTNSFLNFPVKLPPLPEQKKIAAILSTWDRAIEGTEKLLANSQQQKKALMQQLLTGKKRLPGFTGEWKKTNIGNIAKEISIRNKNRKNYPVISCTKTKGFVDSLSFFNKKVYSDDLSGYKIISRNQIGFPSNHIEEGSIGLQNLHDDAIVSPIYTVFSMEENADPLFVFAVLKTDHYRQIFAAATNSSVDRRGSLRWSAFSQIKINLPSLPEQKAIAAVLTTADEEITALESDLSRLSQEKKALMQQLLTGKRRVTVD